MLAVIKGEAYLLRCTHYFNSPLNYSWLTILDMQLIPFLIEQHRKGYLPLEKIVTYYPVGRFLQALKDLKDGKVVKAVLKWEGGDSENTDAQSLGRL
ncbi:hypothetical protein BO82DRAFT_358762 [Aspergillus uvarum CBS 121591]|uniref:Alcohol dehydrogenase-like C-terminal domain-containing protein n=1 Tax=Aspergillus uvarum CBS 121591 TaxID=1448315 RepID=A0A319BX12_9EURO|nr:hypothetical protein BO82DRAFT_358762 [Aspergillus uvarum CBS 121591]PYH76801.1 hypothetical protein BO82DRAFT_358762 [Aspergillus uvarum CBS 121591]